jgi:hypothetical protein
VPSPPKITRERWSIVPSSMITPDFAASPFMPTSSSPLTELLITPLSCG